jgi:rod shape-determining protein MreC
MRSRPQAFLAGSLAAAAVLVFHEPLRGAALALLRSPFTLITTAAHILLTLPRLPSLSRENAALRAELSRQHLEIAQLREHVRHTARGQALLQGASSPQGVVATVIARATVPTPQAVVLDKGERDGLTLDTVILDGAGVIGRVAELRPSSTLVLLLTDPETRVAALIERSRETGLLVGRGRGWCELIYLDVRADLQEGDRVVTAGLKGSFPKGLVLGTVVRIMRDETSGVASAWVSPAARLGQLEEVLCLPVRPALSAAMQTAPAAQ